MDCCPKSPTRLGQGLAGRVIVCAGSHLENLDVRGSSLLRSLCGLAGGAIGKGTTVKCTIKYYSNITYLSCNILPICLTQVSSLDGPMLLLVWTSAVVASDAFVTDIAECVPRHMGFREVPALLTFLA
jgi:hypothetical protein